LNLVNFEFISLYNSCLDVIEASTGPAVMVTINSNKKIFSAGFDLAKVNGTDKTANKYANFLLPLEMLKLYGRVLSIGVSTLAVVDGHCVGAGMFLSMMHDKIIMKDSPKLNCWLPESKIGLGFAPTYAFMVRELMSPSLKKQALLGKKISSTDAYAQNLVQDLFKSEDEAENKISEFHNAFKDLANFRHTFRRSKINVSHEMIKILEKPEIHSHMTFKTMWKNGAAKM
jgi:enoyl-CoA hydratase/carnithine racemase